MITQKALAHPATQSAQPKPATNDQAIADKVQKFFRANQNLIVSLYYRWQDECEYENIADYSKVIAKPVVKIGGKFVKMTKRPFGFVFTLDGSTFHFTINGSRYSFKRIAK